MIVKQARDVARRWVFEHGRATPGFAGAFHHGSTAWLPDEAILPATSDVDVMLVIEGATPPPKPGKLIYDTLLLEVSYVSADRLRSPDLVLGDYHLAGSFRTPSIISDPSGHLTELQAAVSAGFADRQWVRERCEHARSNVLRNLDSLNESDPLHDQVIAWAFASGVLTHVLLVAGLKNPTVRRRYATVHELLAAYGRTDFYETLLEPLGCRRVSRSVVAEHLAALADAFDAATAVITTPFPFASDISDIARPIAIDGSRDLIEGSFHREAVFWLVVTSSRIQKVLHHDAPPEMRDRYRPGYRALLGDLGIRSFTDLQQRREQVRDLLPQVWETAEAILAANPAIHDAPTKPS